MTITKIEKQVNNQKRYSIYIDEKFAFGVREEDLIYFKLKENSEITEQRYNYIMEYVIYTKAKDKAYKFLGYKARSEKEVRDKLTKENYPQEIIDRIIELFKHYNYINDENYTKAYINNRIKFKPRAKRMLKYELAQKGIDSDTIENIIDSSNIDETDIAINLLQKKLKNKKDIEQKEKQRIYNYMLKRGFDYETINKAFKEVLNLHID